LNGQFIIFCLDLAKLWGLPLALLAKAIEILTVQGFLALAIIQ
jgi:hypothetical protein